MKRLVNSGVDTYAYATFTTSSDKEIPSDMTSFVDRLQEIDPNLPLRVVPLEVKVFTPVESRLDEERRASLDNQRIAIEAWENELTNRFTSEMRSLNIAEVQLAGKRT